MEAESRNAERILEVWNTTDADRTRRGFQGSRKTEPDVAYRCRLRSLTNQRNQCCSADFKARWTILSSADAKLSQASVYQKSLDLIDF